MKLCKKHLNLKDIESKDVRSDLYYCTKFGPVYYHRNIEGYMNRSLLFFL